MMPLHLRPVLDADLELLQRAYEHLGHIAPPGSAIGRALNDSPGVVTIGDRKFIEEIDGTFSEVVAVADPVEEVLMHSQQRQHVSAQGVVHPDSPAADVASPTQAPALPVLIDEITAKLEGIANSIDALRFAVDDLHGSAHAPEVTRDTPPAPIHTGVVPLFRMIGERAAELDQELHHQIGRLRQIV